MYQWNDGTYISHHGILGQKWGIRRYQNYDGSLTQRGVKRYLSSKEKYDEANQRYKDARKNKASDTEITNARLSRKKAKKVMTDNYHKLKNDKMADQGKKLYSKGKTITGNKISTYKLGVIGTLSLSASKYLADSGYNDYANAVLAIGGIAVSSSIIKNIADEYQNKRLRAYYSH